MPSERFIKPLKKSAPEYQQRLHNCRVAEQYNLMVKTPFGKYQRGDKITKGGEIVSILSGENKLNVVKINP